MLATGAWEVLVLQTRFVTKQFTRYEINKPIPVEHVNMKTGGPEIVVCVQSVVLGSWGGG